MESAVVRAKQFGMGKPLAVLGRALDPPPEGAVIDAVLVLKEIGGLTRISKRGRFDPNDGELTFAGEIMSKLPLDVRSTKLIILGHMFSCLEECIIIAAGMTTKSIFKSVPKDREIELYHQKLEFAQGSGSDSITMLNVYRKWRKALEDGLKKSHANEMEWCNRQMLDLKCLKEMHQLIDDIEKYLAFFKISMADNTYSAFSMASIPAKLFQRLLIAMHRPALRDSNLTETGGCRNQ